MCSCNEASALEINRTATFIITGRHEQYISFYLCSGSNSKKKKGQLKVELTVCVYVFACMTFVNGAGASVSHIGQR